MKAEERSNQKLTEKQRSVVVSSAYPQYLRAAAGTGKTEVLIQKIVHILLEDDSTALKNFAIITFTNKATDEMRNRLRDGLYGQWVRLSQSSNVDAYRLRQQAETASMADINTIHGFCETLLRHYGLYINVPLDFKVKSFRYETFRIIEDVVSKHYNNPLLDGVPIYRITKLISTLINDCNNKGLRIDQAIVDSLDFNMPDNDYWNKFKPLFISMLINAVESIETEKALVSVLTANDLIRKSVLVLQHEYVAKQVAKKYHYLFIDEFQDTNKDQFEFVKLLIDQGVKVFLVGDDKQSVYAFRGADIENSQAMNDYVRSISTDVDEVALDENFRSDETLIRAINNIFSSKFTFGGQDIIFPTVSLAVPEAKKGTGIAEPIENHYSLDVSDIVKSLLSQTLNATPISYGDIAILCRRNFDLDKIGTELRKSGYPIEIIGGKGFYRSKEVIDTFKLFNAVLYHDDEHINELLFTDYYAAMLSSGGFMEFFDKLTVAFRSEMIESLFALIFDETRIIDYYHRKKNFQAVYNLLKLRDKSREMMNIENLQPLQFLDFLRIMIMTKQEEDDAEIPEQERAQGVIRLYTIHKAKGLSFPIVIVPCLDNKLNRPITLPNVIMDIQSIPPRIAFNKDAVSDILPIDKEYSDMLSINQIKQLEEEVRIFYVACTRAKHRLILASTRSVDKVKQTLKWESYASVAKWLIDMKRGERQ